MFVVRRFQRWTSCYTSKQYAYTTRMNKEIILHGTLSAHINNSKSFKAFIFLQFMGFDLPSGYFSHGKNAQFQMLFDDLPFLKMVILQRTLR